MLAPGMVASPVTDALPAVYILLDKMKHGANDPARRNAAPGAGFFVAGRMETWPRVLAAEFLAQHDAENVGIIVGPERTGAIRLQRRPVLCHVADIAGLARQHHEARIGLERRHEIAGAVVNARLVVLARE